MPFTPEQDTVIKQVLAERLSGFCPTCRNRNWSVAQDLVAFQLLPNVNYPGLGFPAQQLPCIATICNICGNTQFHNVFVLGLGQLFGLTPNELTAPPKASR
jgi:hypothetical protein